MAWFGIRDSDQHLYHKAGLPLTPSVVLARLGGQNSFLCQVLLDPVLTAHPTFRQQRRRIVLL